MVCTAVRTVATDSTSAHVNATSLNRRELFKGGHRILRYSSKPRAIPRNEGEWLDGVAWLFPLPLLFVGTGRIRCTSTRRRHGRGPIRISKRTTKTRHPDPHVILVQFANPFHRCQPRCLSLFRVQGDPHHSPPQLTALGPTAELDDPSECTVRHEFKKRGDSYASFPHQSRFRTSGSFFDRGCSDEHIDSQLEVQTSTRRTSS